MSSEGCRRTEYISDFLIHGRSWTGSPNASVSPTRATQRLREQFVHLVAVRDTNSLLFVSSTSCCCPSLGLDGPAGLDPVSACFLWGGQRLERCSPSCIKPQGGTSYFLLSTCGLICITAASSCFSVTLILILIETEKFIAR